MSSNRINFADLFPNFQKKDDFFKRITSEEGALKKIFSLYFILCALSFFYGAAMGSYHSFLQAVTAGVKVTVLYTLVLVICFPAFFIIQYILGSKLRLYQMITIILSGFVLTAAITVSFIPVVIFFLLTGSNYYFLQLLHISVFIIAGLFGMKIVMDALKYSCETRNIYPQTGVVVFRFWVVILAFVGMQLAWHFRPFLGDRGEPYQMFRQYEGNFYTAVIYSVKQLFQEEESGEFDRGSADRGITKNDTLRLYPGNTIKKEDD
ncbi:MAG: hypothetical protein GY863_15430 [bacterium]|nr:hypothetical protein [bacterium]